jgi:hypothetical protein
MINDNYTAPFGAGVGLFNASISPIIAVQVDRFFPVSINSFLNNPQMCLDITPDELKSLSCADGPQPGQNLTCERTVFMPGSVPAEVAILNDLPEADLFIAYAMRGYVLKYEQSTASAASWLGRAECRPYGKEYGAVSLCMQNTNSGHLLTSKCASRVLVSV